MSGIPPRLHFIWISNQGKTAKDIPELLIENAKRTQALGLKSDINWEINLWIDKKTQNLPSVKNLKAAGFKLHKVDEEFNLLDDQTFYKNWVQIGLYYSSTNLGIRVDALKYYILNKHGGFINDFNFVYNRLPNTLELESNELIFYKSHIRADIEPAIENSFMGSMPNHQYFTTLTQVIDRNSSQNKFCLRYNPDIPEEDLQHLLNNLEKQGIPTNDEKNLLRLKQLYCCTKLTVDPLNAIDLTGHPNILQYTVLMTYCYSEEHCFGYDSKSISVESWVLE